MANLSTSGLNLYEAEGSFSVFGNIYNIGKGNRIREWLIGTLVFLTIFLFLPWTQNIRSKGTVTTLRQEQRAQEVNSIIAGRVLKWYVKEGDFVKKGDTLMELGEIKTEYFDPNLIARTREQINAKLQSMQGYENKAKTASSQIEALEQGRELKLQSLDNKLRQQYLKVVSDSTDLIAAKNDLSIAKRQFEAAKALYDSGAISLVDYERRKISYQNSQAKNVGIENKLMQSRQELIGLRIEKSGVVQDYADKISKADGERFASLSNIASTEAEVSKLENTFSNYAARNNFYFILAPQDGQLVKAKKEGIGETVKEGEIIAEVVPTPGRYAVEMFVEPMNLPLISIGQKVRFVFDGFPALVFSGWPKGSYGTFGGKVMAIESSLSPNGKFRVLVSEDPDDRPWPDQIKLGGGASAIALLKQVPIYYELWRNINGFPPDFYESGDLSKKEKDGKGGGSDAQKKKSK